MDLKSMIKQWGLLRGGGKEKSLTVKRKWSLSTKHLWMEELQWGMTNVLISYGHPETEKGSRKEVK